MRSIIWYVAVQIAFGYLGQALFPDRVVFLDIDEGDAIYLKLGEYEILLDGGGNGSTYDALAKERFPLGASIDLYLISHWHTDHYLGAVELIEHDRAERLLYPDFCIPKSIGVEPISLNSAIYQIEGYTLTLLVSPTNSFECPFRAGNLSEQINNSSLILLVEDAEKVIIFLGDIHQNREKDIIKTLEPYAEGRKVVLKAGHHCSSTSTSVELLEVLKPELVICTAGKKNRHGHPHQVVLDRIVQSGADVLVVAEEGSITVPLYRGGR